MKAHTLKIVGTRSDDARSGIAKLLVVIALLFLGACSDAPDTNRDATSDTSTDVAADVASDVDTDASVDGIDPSVQCQMTRTVLEATECEPTDTECYTDEDVHHCCNVVVCSCGVNPGPREPGQTWGCYNIGCAANAEECPGVCEVNPRADFCPRDDADATDGAGDTDDAASTN